MTDPNANVPARHRRPILLLVSAGLLFLGVGLFFALRSVPDNDLVWLTPAQLAQVSKPGLWTKLKSSLRNRVRPLLPYFRRSRPNIVVGTELWWRTDEEARRETPPRPALSTNAEGVLVWELSPAELARLRTQSHPIPMNSLVAPSGVRGVLSVPGGLTRDGVLIVRCDVTASYLSGSIRLLLGVTPNPLPPPPPGQAGPKRSNFDLACRASFPNGGALLIEEPGPANGTNYWLLVSATAIDARGNPLMRSHSR